MAEKLKIKISIADRVYPLTVETTQEEGLRTASKKIDATIKNLKQAMQLETSKMFWPCVPYSLLLKLNKNKLILLQKQ